MRCEGLVPDVITYNTVMDVCQKSGHWKLALQIFRQLLLSGSHTADVIDVIDVITMNTAMGAYLRLGDSGRWSDTGRYGSEIDARVSALSSRRDVYNINVFIIVAHPCTSHIYIIYIYTILIHSISIYTYATRGPTPIHLSCTKLAPWHHGIAPLLRKGGNWQQALLLLSEMPQKQLMPSTISALFERLQVTCSWFSKGKKNHTAMDNDS